MKTCLSKFCEFALFLEEINRLPKHHTTTSPSSGPLSTIKPQQLQHRKPFFTVCATKQKLLPQETIHQGHGSTLLPPPPSIEQSKSSFSFTSTPMNGKISSKVQRCARASLHRRQSLTTPSTLDGGTSPTSILKLSSRYYPNKLPRSKKRHGKDGKNSLAKLLSSKPSKEEKEEEGLATMLSRPEKQHVRRHVSFLDEASASTTAVRQNKRGTLEAMFQSMNTIMADEGQDSTARSSWSVSTDTTNVPPTYPRRSNSFTQHVPFESGNNTSGKRGTLDAMFQSMNTIMANEGPDEDAGIARPEMLSGSNSTASLSTNVSTVLPKYHHNTHNSLELFAEAMGDICR